MGWPFFAENRRRRENREIDLFAKWPFSRLFARFFGHPPRKSFFVDSGQLSSGNTSVEVDTRETLQNKGFRSDVAALCLFEHFGRVETASFCGPLLRIIFSVGYYFVRFHVRNFVEIGFPSSKNAWGCRTELVLKSVFFAVCPLRAQIWRAGGAQRCRFFFGGFRVPVKNGLAAAVRRVFPSFPVFFFDPVFENLKWSSSHPRLFLWVFFSFVRILLGIGGNAALHVCFWAVGLRPFLFFGGFWGLLRKALFFPLKKGYLGSFLSVSLLCLPFVLLGVFHFSLSLSLSLSLFLLFFLFFFFLVVFSLFLPSLFFGCSFLSCCFVFVSWEEQHQNITFESFIFIIYVCLFFCFVFQICSYLCFFII